MGLSNEDDDARTVIPASISEMFAWDVVERERPGPSWDALWNAPGEESRERQFAADAFVLDLQDLMNTPGDPDAVRISEAALKVCFPSA